MYTSMRFSRLASWVIVALSATCGAEYAAADDDNDSGPYVGGAYGQFNVSADDVEGLTEAIGDIDADDGAWKLFFGWRFNPFIALELDYVDLGNPRGDFDADGSSGDYSIDLAGMAGYVIGTLPLGIFEFSGKVGYYAHDVDIEVDFDNIGANNGDVFENSDNGEAIVYGVAAGMTLIEHINVQVEYELFDLDEADDAYALWLSAAWRF